MVVVINFMNEGADLNEIVTTGEPDDTSPTERFYDELTNHPIRFLLGIPAAFVGTSLLTLFDGFTGLINSIFPGSIPPDTPLELSVNICAGLFLSMLVLTLTFYFRSQILASRVHRSIAALQNASKTQERGSNMRKLNMHVT